MKKADAEVVIDTMVFAYALLKVPHFYQESMAVLEAADEIVVPDSCRAELANVVWKWVQYDTVSVEVGQAVLADANTLFTRTVSTALLWRPALQYACEKNHPVYDTLFVALAEQEQTLLVTYDAKLRRKFPTCTISPIAFLRP